MPDRRSGEPGIAPFGENDANDVVALAVRGHWPRGARAQRDFSFARSTPHDHSHARSFHASSSTVCCYQAPHTGSTKRPASLAPPVAAAAPPAPMYGPPAAGFTSGRVRVRPQPHAVCDPRPPVPAVGSSSNAGSGSRLLHFDEDGGDVVLAASLVGELDEATRPLLRLQQRKRPQSRRPQIAV